MGTFSAWHWLIVLAILLLLFGRGKIPQLMADLGRGIREFKKGMQDTGDDNNTDTTGSGVS
ncbi:MAG: twin-arginine translocase TatA/TatE family subunit [Alphaproteobacteria bacterium]|uniref:twin-arginine translocase TatA/TatE family subunit n=1 Tax=Pseudorhizobium pelagicum TaxID=1509405 RepID=UPI00055B9E04|nr:twin-arginine translocase TatA/TatE family subunit [Pseudorhizobium pelagicum]MBU1313757.1 twin-arginine translocase TatA/TatE family subunit [Alphaproteobacteria bacterium]MDY6961864.1 twin-arginine translocase TatA/TatE family subunit [Pseudomonadota bacterium]MBU1548623.1 twin-arginine translocase TatA/TatE family subunit [Alphaproteobacteria bacterium]MBU2334415.1 twin-arginine translocase TatA/TatE family subunit [Alphaproteobacteria bacterium]MBU2388479.1 twin-arginine translocase Tat|tara:strand:+ start:394 stop:576 length:183 start_codon:yes stop_codon:yes gene_type:complete